MREYPNVCPNLLIMGEAHGNVPDKYWIDHYAMFPYPVNSAGYKLQHLMRLSRLEYVGLARRNLLRYYPGAINGLLSSGGSAFPIKDAINAARDVIKSNVLWDKNVLFVGKRLAGVFGLGKEPILEWRATPTLPDGTAAFRFAIVPHTSGINRWWNENENEYEGGEFLASVGRQVLAGAQVFE